MPSQEQISQELENMYGASFDCGISKTGDNHILKFYLEVINDNFIPQTEEKVNHHRQIPPPGFQISVYRSVQDLPPGGKVPPQGGG